MIKTIKHAREVTGGIGFTTKTGFSYGLPARTACNVGCKLAKIEGTTCFGCYATQNNYRYSSVKKAQKNRFNAVKKACKDLECHDLWVDAMVFLINKETDKNPESMWYFRWHDSGDILNVEHLQLIYKVAKKTPHVKHWIPTKEEATVKEFLKTHRLPKNMTIRLSAQYIDKPADYELNLPKAVVYTRHHEPKNKAHICPSIINHKGCLGNNCRMCWDKRVRTVAYKKH